MSPAGDGAFYILLQQKRRAGWGLTGPGGFGGVLHFKTYLLTQGPTFSLRLETYQCSLILFDSSTILMTNLSQTSQYSLPMDYGCEDGMGHFSFHGMI